MTVIVLILHIGYLLMAYTHTDNLVPVIGMLILAYTVYITNVAQYIWRTHQHNRQLAAVRVRSR
jgi:CHASE2 domain-containing sensor protein